MGTVVVVSVLLVSGVVCGRGLDYSRESAAKGLPHLDFLYPGRRARHEHGFLKLDKENGDRTSSKIGRTILPVFIPVRYDLRKTNALERRGTEDDSINPRLVMDQDFNIQFDNPNILPLTKPLAFILSSSVNARQSRTEEDDEKVLIPFPVLVKDREGSKDCRDDDVLEHRSNYDHHDDGHDDFENEEPPSSRKDVIPTYRYAKNGTTTFHKTNTPHVGDFVYSARGKNYPEYSNHNIPSGRTQDHSNSSREYHPSLDVYPSKIFADMYRAIPKHALESVESQEVDDYYSYDKRRHAEDIKFKPIHRQRYRGHAFSASNDLHWVTDGNSTKMKKPNEDLKSFVIYDVTEPPVPSTTLAPSTTTILPDDFDWGKKL